MMKTLLTIQILGRTEMQIPKQTRVPSKGRQKRGIDSRVLVLAIILTAGCADQPPAFVVEAEEDDEIGSVADSEILTHTDTDTSPEEDAVDETPEDAVDETPEDVEMVNDDDDSQSVSCPHNATFQLTTHKEFSVLDSHDDAEEAVFGNNTFPEGSVYLDSTDLEMTDDAKYLSSKQVVGIRFAEVKIPKAALVKEAYVEFVSDNDESIPTDLTISVEASDNAKKFTASPFNISKRPRVTSLIAWYDISPWEENSVYRSPDISSAIQEVICRNGWRERNAIVVIIEGRGVREAVSYDQSPQDAASLHVTYSF